MNSRNSLDNLAANGIINFDADAYVNGTEPRFYGSPRLNTCLPLDNPIFPGPAYGITAGPHLSGHPTSDAFISKGGHGTKQFSFEKILTVGIVAALLTSCFSKIKSTFTRKSEKPSKVGTWLKEAKENAISFFNKGTKTEATSEAKAAGKATEKAVEKSAEKVAEKEATFWAKHGGKFKKGGLGLVAVLGLYGLYNYFSGSKKVDEIGHGLQLNEAIAHRNQMNEVPQGETHQPLTH